MILTLAQAAEAAPAQPAWLIFALAVLALLSSSGLITAVAALVRAKAREAEANAAKAEAERQRDASLVGLDRATTKLDPAKANALREELRQAQREAGVQPDVDERLKELRNGGAS